MNILGSPLRGAFSFSPTRGARGAGAPPFHHTQKRVPLIGTLSFIWLIFVQLSELFLDLDNNSGTNGTAALADSEAQTLLDGDGGDQLNIHLNVITRHAHLYALGQGDNAGNVSGTEIELRTIVVEEGGMTAAFRLLQYVNLATELGVGMDGAGFAQYLTTLNFSSLNTTQQSTDVIASLSIVQQLTEHLNTGNYGLAGVMDTNDLNFVANLNLTTLNTAGSYGTTAGDGEYVLDGHQEGQVSLTLRSRNILVNSVHQSQDGSISGIGRILAVALQGLQSGTLDYGDLVAGEIVAGEQLTDLDRKSVV